MGGSLPATSGADAAGGAGGAFTAALDSACDAQVVSRDAVAETPPEDTHAGTSRGLATWFLAIGAGAEPQGTAPADATDDMSLPASGDDENVGETASAEDAVDAAADINTMVVVPVVDVVTAAPAVRAGAAPGDTVQENGAADDAIARADSGDGHATREAAAASGSTPDAASSQRVSREETTWDGADEATPGERPSETERASKALDATPEPMGMGPDAAGARSASTAATEARPVERPELSGTLSEAGQTGRSSAPNQTRPSQSASAPASSAKATPQGVPSATIASPDAAPASPPESSRAVAPETMAVPATPAAEGRGATDAGETRKPVDDQGAAPQIAASSPVGQESPSADSPRHRNETDTPGQHRGLDAAVARTSAAAMLTLVAGPDGTLRLTPGAPVAPLASSMLPQDQTANIDQMVRTMRVLVKEQVTEATVRLRPEHFGDVTIQVRMDGKAVSAIIHTDSSQVRDWLLGQEGTLRTGLSEQGLQLERLQVQRDGRQDRRDADQQPPERRRQRQRPQSDSQQTFEITV